MKRHIISVAVLVLAAGCSEPAPTSDEAEPTAAATTPAAAATVAVPHVLGMPAEEAAAALEEAGLTPVERVGDPPSSGQQPGTVQSQSVTAGTEVEEGSEVELLIWDEAEPLKLGRGSQIAIFEATMEQHRTGIIEEIEDGRIVESVDRFEFDRADEVLVVAATSGFGTQEYIEDDGWELARYLAAFWEDDFWGDDNVRDPEWWPALSMEISGHAWSCDAEAMRALAQRRSSRGDWEAACDR